MPRLRFYCSRPRPDLPSFPTRRSSDLRCWLVALCLRQTCALRDRCARRRHENHRRPEEKRKAARRIDLGDRKSTRLNSSHVAISYAVFCVKKKITKKKVHRSKHI